MFKIHGLEHETDDLQKLIRKRVQLRMPYRCETCGALFTDFKMFKIHGLEHKTDDLQKRIRKRAQLRMSYLRSYRIKPRAASQRLTESYLCVGCTRKTL